MKPLKRRRIWLRRVLVAVVVVALPVSLAGCQSSAPGGEESHNRGGGDVRTDLEPLTKRFPALGTPRAAWWLGDILGDDRVPGPSTYRIRAVVELDSTVAENLRGRYSPAAVALPELDPRISVHVPDGGVATSDSLSAAFGDERWRSDAYLHANRPVLVLVSTGS